MQLPEELQQAIEQLISPSSTLQKASASLTQDYKAGRSSPFDETAKRLAYLGTRMPATYAAAYRVLQEIPPDPPFAFEHLLDLGAGPATASWAACALFPQLKKITLIERSQEAIELGKKLAAHCSHPALRQALWLHQSLSEPLPAADAAIIAYALGELDNPHDLIERCFRNVSLLILIEPGTPKGFSLIRSVRQQLLQLQAHPLAPCPHTLPCPIQGTDWCHFSARIERSRLHRLLKEGALNYEDEKFSYLIMAKQPTSFSAHRIIRRPHKGSGHVRLTLCTREGTISEKVITRKEKEAYRKARDAVWGETI